MKTYRDIVFTGPPSHESGRFVEVEDQDGKSVGDFGQWIERHDGYWALRTSDSSALVAALRQIASGTFPNASTIAVTGDWHAFTNALQSIAKLALSRSMHSDGSGSLQLDVTGA